ncbi:hypothetical protein TCAL_03609 [Tigriopus californicus]|uniref:Uncharacterized protein n=1 Tax=Tigriopus californicus TaxID=6832 RepID=A0A553NBH3_TIGCA|nr:uncharacterized protein LOC131889041 [Tigriopus californicus]TRY62796.1 hypothetical protein TCAL_03609 [Tigriopus californicus]|eukprot:TCALIF_03609-PA protein Name:"Protein of unknown function" AED:0.00 eAED:0.00 QI:156/1/1/1/1/1/2/183/190
MFVQNGYLMVLILALGQVSGQSDRDWLTSTNSLHKTRPSSTSYENMPQTITDFGEVFNAFQVMARTAMKHLVEGFLPSLREAVSRAKREAQEDEQDYLDALVTGMGAMMDRQRCRQRVTCNAGKILQTSVPGSQVMVMLMEAVVPTSWMDWYSTVKTSVIDRSDNCFENYECDLLENQTEKRRSSASNRP